MIMQHIKYSQAFQLNCNRKHLTIAFDFRVPSIDLAHEVISILGHPVGTFYWHLALLFLVIFIHCHLIFFHLNDNV